MSNALPAHSPAPERRFSCLIAIPRIGGNERLLLGLVFFEGATANNLSRLGREMGCSRTTAYTRRQEALRQGWLEERSGYLVPGKLPDGIRWDRLPAELMRKRGIGHKRKCAAAVVHEEGVGSLSGYIRSDSHRSDLAGGVCRDTVRDARKVLVGTGLDKLERVQRGRCKLTRTKVIAGKNKGAYFLGDKRKAQLAARSEAARRRCPSFRKSSRSSFKKSSLNHSELRSGTTMGLRPVDGRGSSLPSDGQAKPTVRALADRIVAGTGKRLHSERADADQRQAGARATVERLLAQPGRIEDYLASHSTAQTTVGLLEAAHVFDTAPRVRQKWATALVEKLGDLAPEAVVCILVDVMRAGGRSRAKSVGAIVAKRIRQLLGADPRRSLSRAGVADMPRALAAFRKSVCDLPPPPQKPAITAQLDELPPASEDVAGFRDRMRRDQAAARRVG